MCILILAANVRDHTLRYTITKLPNHSKQKNKQKKNPLYAILSQIFLKTIFKVGKNKFNTGE